MKLLACILKVYIMMMMFAVCFIVIFAVVIWWCLCSQQYVYELCECLLAL